MTAFSSQYRLLPRRGTIADGGEGLGTAGLPHAKLGELCERAGFSEVKLLPLENPFNNVYEIRP